MNLIQALEELEDSDELHIGRVLILLNAFAGRDGSKPLGGLTKLAKLDFLLRYPVYLERALREEGARAEQVHTTEAERVSVESSMVRFRYGPWDARHRRILNLLVGKGLVSIEMEGTKVEIYLTSKGLEIAKELASQGPYSDIALRSRLLKRHFDYSGSYLMNFVYRTFPEIENLSLGQEIPP